MLRTVGLGASATCVGLSLLFLSGHAPVVQLIVKNRTHRSTSVSRAARTPLPSAFLFSKPKLLQKCLYSQSPFPVLVNGLIWFLSQYTRRAETHGNHCVSVIKTVDTFQTRLTPVTLALNGKQRSNTSGAFSS